MITCPTRAAVNSVAMCPANSANSCSAAIAADNGGYMMASATSDTRLS